MQTKEDVQYHWVMHDGANLGMQEITDSKLGIKFVVAFLSGESGFSFQVRGLPLPEALQQAASASKNQTKTRKGRLVLSLASVFGGAGSGISERTLTPSERTLTPLSNRLGEMVGLRLEGSRKVFLVESPASNKTSPVKLLRSRRNVVEMFLILRFLLKDCSRGL